ncbi:MAG: 3'-5' exonuclease [Planctomycetes bacterium]|nr:3'-5' exonuclease [Planctomycetota bacterium]
MARRRINFTVVDFETCAHKRESACAVGVVQVVDGRIGESFYTLLKPPERPYWNFVDIHGITREMVRDAPTFPEIWPQLRSIIGEGPFVAHNAPFDWSVLTRTLAYYNLPAVDLPRVCTCRLARQALPQLTSHTLDAIAGHWGIKLDHHHAASDARACAEIAIRLWSM